MSTKKSKVEMPTVAAPGFTQIMPDVADKRATLRTLIQKQNESAGHKVLAFANEVPNTFEIRRPSGIVQIDLETAGGLPAGAISEISGPNGAGKSFLAMRYCMMHQKLYGEQAFIAYAVTEGLFDFRRAMNIGLKVSVPDEIIEQWNQERELRGMPRYTEPEYLFFKEKVGEFVIIRGNTGEEIMQAVADSLRSNLFGIIVVDSISQLLPDADAEKDMEEHNKMAGNANLLTKFINRSTPAFNGLDGLNSTTLIMINQVRANTERANAPSHMQKYLKQWATTGSYAARHAKHIDITIWNASKLEKTIKGEKTIIGKEVNFELMKGKTGTHENIKGQFNFFYDNYLPSGIDEVEDLITVGMGLGVIVERAGKISVIQPESGNPTQVVDIPGLPTFKKMLQAEFELYLLVLREVLAGKAGKMCLWR